MTCGIYKLEFSNGDFYIGQSNNIEKRYRTHCNKLSKQAHVNSKLQITYNNLDEIPSLEILCECLEKDLDKYELEAFEIFNPISSLNIAPAGGDFPVAFGEDSAVSKYTNEYLIDMVRYFLSNKDMSLKVLASTYGVHYSTAKNVSNGTSHTWLAEVIPEEYAELISMKGTRPVNSISAYKGRSYTVISPEGTEHIVNHITNFAKEFGLNRGAFGQVLAGKAHQHKGWKLK